MGKKMKGVAPFDLSTYGASGSGGYGDAKMSLKHQTLLQDYQELERETGSMKTKLEIVKKRKRSLLAEVSFLRRRYRYLSSVKSATNLKEQELVARVSSGSQKKLSSHNWIPKKKVDRLHQLPPLPNSCHRGRVYSGKEDLPNSCHRGRVYSGKEDFHGDTGRARDLNRRQFIRIGKEVAQHNNYRLSDINKKRINNASKKSSSSYVAPFIDLNLRKESQQHYSEPNNKRKFKGSKKAAVSNVAPVIDLNLTDRLHIGNDVSAPNTTQLLDLNQDSSLGGREPSFSGRAPIFDLNEVSIAEDDLQNNPAPLEELKISLMKAGNDDQFNHDLKLFSGEDSSRVGKRKISWQDPVALRV